MPIAIRNILIQILDMVYREPKLIFTYYRQPRAGRFFQTTRYIFMVDGRVGHGGMFDRLKGLISVYAVAKSQQKDFRIHWTYPFTLEKYLVPNHYDWRVDEASIVYHYPQSRPLFLYGECYAPCRLMKNRQRESHFYYGYNSLKEINERFSTHYNWGTLYRELFKPSPYLQKYLDHYQNEIGSGYIAVHTRFLNLLGDKTETDINPELSEEERLELMNKAVAKIQEIHACHPSSRMMLATDSMTFIRYAQERIPDLYVVPGTVKHIDTAGETDDSENIKMFTDYYLLAQANKVYSLWHEGMWKSAFPEYAAVIGEVEFERLIF
ncbi:MAG: hypothetical protein PUH24_01360 [Prevotellaceae bacterium]|nr:hypothetical protein [Prevotellaceae bacterium]